MRKPIFILSTFILALFTIVSCEDDDNFNNENEGEIVLTNENNLYEGDLYVLYLEQDIEVLDETIVYLDSLIMNNQGTPQIELQLAEAQEQRDMQIDNLAFQMGIEAQYVLPPRVPRTPVNPPIPPLPCEGCFPLPGSFTNITISPDISSLNIRILDYNTEDEIETVTFNTFNPAANYGGVVSIQSANLNNFTGQAIVIIERLGVNNDIPTTYSLNMRFY